MCEDESWMDRLRVVLNTVHRWLDLPSGSQLELTSAWEPGFHNHVLSFGSSPSYQMILLLMVFQIATCGSKSMHCYCALSPWESCNPGTRSSCNDRVPPPGLASEGARVWGSLTSSPAQECAVLILLPPLLPGGDLTNELCHLKNHEDRDTWVGQ